MLCRSHAMSEPLSTPTMLDDPTFVRESLELTGKKDHARIEMRKHLRPTRHCKYHFIPHCSDTFAVRVVFRKSMIEACRRRSPA